jgi:hypothetical protein
MNHGAPEKMYLDPLTHSAYNKISHAKERIVLAGSPQQATGASLKEQWVAGGAIALESSRFLSAKTSPARPRANTPAAPSFAPGQTANTTSLLAGEVYQYSVTAVGDAGESPAAATQAVTIATNGNQVDVVITPAAGIAARYFNVYRSNAGETRKAFIGRVKNSGAATSTLVDLNSRLPFGVQAMALDMRGIEICELSKYSSKELASTNLSAVKAFFRFAAVVAKLPRFNIITDNCLP